MSRNTKLELTGLDDGRHRRRIVDRLNWAVGLWNQLLDKLTIGGPTEPINFCDVLYVDCVNGRVGVGKAPGDLFEAYKAAGVARIQIISDDSAGNLRFLNRTATPAADTLLGRVAFRGLDDGGNLATYGTIEGYVTDDTAGSEDGYILIAPTIAGSLTEILRFDSEGVTVKNDLWFSGSGSGLPYGGISAVDNATETTISTAGVAVQITIFDTNNPSNLTTPDHTNDHVTINKAGDYFIAVSATVNSVAGASSRFEMTVQKNNGATLLAPLHCDRNIAGGGGSSGVISMSGIVTLAANDTVEVWIENETNTQNYVVENISLDMFMVGG